MRVELSDDEYCQIVCNLIACPLDDYMRRACLYYKSVGIPTILAARNLRIHLRAELPEDKQS